MNLEDRIRVLVELESDELMAVLGAELLGAQLDQRPRDLRSAAQEWLDELLARIKDDFCSRPAIIALCDDSSKDLTEGAIAIGQALLQLATSGNLTVNLVSVIAPLLAKRGVRTYCIGSAP